MPSNKESKSTRKVVLYTDGSCAPTNPGPGGWAFLPILNNEPDQLVCGGEAHSTNNRMELTAALEALKSREDGEAVELVTDSEYLRLGITQWMSAWIRNGWIRRKGQPVLNKDLWIALHEQNQRVKVEWRWVKAHAGHSFNEMVDHAARDAAITASKQEGAVLDIARRELTESDELSSADVYSVAAVYDGKSRSAWALVCDGDGTIETEVAVEEKTSVNRALLTGAVTLMRSIATDELVRVITDSEYLYKGITQWLESWQQRGWRKADNKPIANQDLWIEIYALRERTRIDWRLERRSDDRQSSSLVQVAAKAAREALET